MRRVALFRPCLLMVTASALLLTGCGDGGSRAPGAAALASTDTSPTRPVSSSAADPTEAGTRCGKVPALHGAQAEVVIRGGTVDCTQATLLITQYFQKLSPAEAAAPDGAGPVALGEWTCGSGAHDPVTSCSTEDNRQVDGVVAG